jgi:hypothetical protein
VTDLTAAELAVEIDGDKRQVSTVEYIRSADPLRVIGAPRKVEARRDLLVFELQGAPSGRLIVLLDRPGQHPHRRGAQLDEQREEICRHADARRRVSVIAVPSPGELVDFTTDHDKVREALLRIVGTAEMLKPRYNLSITEAMAIYMHSDAQMASEVIVRECAGAAQASELERCEREVEQDAAEIIIEIRRRTQDSINGMRAVFKGLGAMEGPKSVVLLEGLIFEGLGSETRQLRRDRRGFTRHARRDAARRAAVRRHAVAAVDHAARGSHPAGHRIEQLAGASRGELYRINVSADFAFDRISRSLDGYYLLGVESRPDDRNGRRHRIGVKTTRRGVTIRSRRSFVTAMSAKATTPVDGVVARLRSPLPINDLPLKISTWTYKEPGSRKIRVLVAAEAERLVDQPLDYTVGMAIMNKQGRGVGPPVERKKLIEKSGDPGTAVFSGMLMVDPGEYKVILSMADSEAEARAIAERSLLYHHSDEDTRLVAPRQIAERLRAMEPAVAGASGADGGVFACPQRRPAEQTVLTRRSTS